MNVRRIAAAFFAIASTGAFACDCSQRALPVRLESSSLVFVGEVQGAEGKDRVVFRVLEQFKGPPTTRVTVETQHSLCDYFPVVSVAEPGTRHLVFVQFDGGRNHVHQCSGSAVVEKATEDLRALRDTKRQQPER